MLVQVNGEKQIIHVTSVTISAHQGDYNIKMFFCYNCQSPVVQYSGAVDNISAGTLPDSIPIYTLCKHCRTLYSFQGIAYM